MKTRPEPLQAARAAAVALSAALLGLAAAGPTLAAPGSLMAVVPGSGELTINGAKLAVDKVIYFHWDNNGRTSFSVFTDAGAIGFSGNVDARPQPHLYSLTVDSIVRTKTDKDSVRTAAVGLCDLHYGAAQTAVTAIDCKADGDSGPVILHFTGDGEPARVTPLADGTATADDTSPH